MSTPRFRVIEVLAQGTFGTVCLAEDSRTGQLLALKPMRAAHQGRPELAARARDEARLLGELSHPNIVRVLRLLNIKNRPVMAMEWLRGADLRALQNQHDGGLPLDVAVEIIRRVSLALDAAWSATPKRGGAPLRIIHRDIKPSNIMLTVEGRVKVLDFGIAKTSLADREAKTNSMVLGARNYLAPERLDGQQDAPSGDVFSVGLVLYELLCGAPLLSSVDESKHDEQLRTSINSLHPAGLADMPLRNLRTLIAAMCAYDPTQRPSNQGVAHHLGRIQQQSQLVTDLSGFARAEVFPLFLKRTKRNSLEDFSHVDVRFLHSDAPPHSNPPADARLTELLQSDTWKQSPQALFRLLALYPNATPAPILRRLPEHLPAAWRVWETQPKSDHIVTLLQCLGPHINAPDVQQRLALLSKHPSSAVRAQVEKLLGAR